MLMYPKAEVPIVQLFIRHSLYLAEHFALGMAVSDLRQ
jgi:aromatic ring-opening dioxygenase catalytic subunit (LigB family)